VCSAGPGLSGQVADATRLPAAGQGANTITPDEVKELLTQRKFPLIENFISKRGNKFAAHLVLSAKKDKAEFEFLPR
jgi:hypothetical protein